VDLTKAETVSLQSLGGGALVEQFEYALLDVLRNIQDPNTSPSAAREIVMKATFKPPKDSRNVADIILNVTTKLAPNKSYSSRVYIGRGESGIEAREVIQGALFPEAEPGKVVPMEKEAVND